MNNKIAIPIILILGFSNLNAQEKYLNPEIDIDTRVDDLISRLTLEEKVDQI